MEKENWRVLLAKDLRICQYLNKVWEKDDNNLKLIPLAKKVFIEHVYKPVLSSTSIEENNFFWTPNEYIERLCNAGIISYNKSEEVITLPKYRLPFSSRQNFMSFAKRLWSNKQSDSRIEIEVFNFIKGNLIFEYNTIKYFRLCNEIATDMFINKVDNSEEEIINRSVNELNADLLGKQIIIAFYEMCITERILYQLKEKSNTMKWRGKPNFWLLLSKLFGLPNNIEGLSFLFMGGIPLINPPGNNILILGEVASGKTTLANQIAYEVADKGGLSVYIALEQDSQILENIYASFGWLPKEDLNYHKLSISSLTSFLHEIKVNKNILKENEGDLLLIDATPGGLTEIFDLIDFIVTTLNETKPNKPKLIVIDPINAIRGVKKNNEENIRETTTRLLERIRKNNFSSLLVAEDQGDNATYIYEKNLCDTVILLETSREKYKKRILNIEKSRIIPSVRGDSRFVITLGYGVTIYPSAAAYVAAKRGRNQEPLGKTMESGVNGLDRMLGEKGIQCGTITSFVGSSGCGKRILGINWLLNGSIKENDVGIYIDFTRKGDSIYNILQKNNHPELRRLLHMNNLDCRIQLDEFFNSYVISIPLEGLTSGKIFQKLDSKIRMFKSRGHDSFRILIDDLSYLELVAPDVANDNSFLPALIETVHTDHIALVCCFSMEEERDIPSNLENEIVLASDNIINFSKIEIDGFQRIAAFTSKSINNDYVREAQEVIINSDNICVENNFSLFAGIKDGSPYLIDIEFYLHEESATQKSYNEYLQQHYIDSTANRVSIHSRQFPERKLPSILRGGIIEKNIRILQVDDPQLDALDMNDLFLIPVEKVDNESDILKCCMERIITGDANYFKALPYFINLPLLLCHKEKDVGLEVYSWSSLADWVNEYHNKQVNNNALGFDFVKGTSRNYICLFLEILFSISGENNKSFDSFIHFKDFISTFGENAAVIFWKLGNRSHLNTRNKIKKRGSNNLSSIDLEQSPVFSRVWYSNLADIIKPDNEMDYELKRLPGDREILGSWYLVIPKNCAAPDISVDLCTELCDKDNSIDRYERGVGMPIYKSLYWSPSDSHDQVFNFVSKHLNKALKKAIVRGAIPGYHNFRRTLSFYLQRILEVKQHKNEVPINEIIKVFKQIGWQ